MGRTVDPFRLKSRDNRKQELTAALEKLEAAQSNWDSWKDFTAEQLKESPDIAKEYQAARDEVKVAAKNVRRGMHYLGAVEGNILDSFKNLLARVTGITVGPSEKDLVKAGRYAIENSKITGFAERTLARVPNLLAKNPKLTALLGIAGTTAFVAHQLENREAKRTGDAMADEIAATAPAKQQPVYKISAEEYAALQRQMRGNSADAGGSHTQRLEEQRQLATAATAAAL